MAVPIDNNGSTFYNQNECKSFKQTISTSLVQLAAYPCSEVIIVNRTGGAVNIFDNNNFSLNNSFLLGASESFTFRGITNTSTISASGTTVGDLYYRTQYFSVLPQR